MGPSPLPYPLIDPAPFTIPDESALIVSAPGLSIASVAFPSLLYPLSPSDPRPLFVDCPMSLQSRFPGDHVTSQILITRLLREKNLFFPFVVLICPEQNNIMRKDPQNSILGFCLTVLRRHSSSRSDQPSKVLAFTSDLGFASSNFKPILNVLNIAPSAAVLIPRFHVAFEPLRDTTPYTESYTRPQVTRKEVRRRLPFAHLRCRCSSHISLCRFTWRSWC